MAALLATLSVLFVTTLSYLTLRSHTRKILHALLSACSNLGFSPSQLDGVDVILVLSIIVSKSILRFLGLVPNLTVSSNGEGFSLPRIQLSAPLSIDKDQRDKYAIALGQILEVSSHGSDGQHQDAKPSLLLAALTTPLFLFTVAHYKSPVLPFGAVNVRNRFEFLDPARCAACQGKLLAVATSGGEGETGRRTKRGIEFDVEIQVFEEGSRNAKTPIFRQVVTTLQNLPRNTRPLFTEAGETTPVQATRGFSLSGIAPVDVDEQERQRQQQQITNPLRISADAPLSWAKVCRDYNPIHMSRLAGQVFGLPGRIAHGNHVAAAALELLQQLDPPEILFARPWAMNVNFRRPMVVPTTMELSAYAHSIDRTNFAVSKNGKIYVEGHVEPLRAP